MRVKTSVCEVTTCLDDSCDGSHCKVCGGHFVDFYGGHGVCDFCASLSDEDQLKIKTEIADIWKQRYEN